MFYLTILKAKVKFSITLNEAFIVENLGFGYGSFAPGSRTFSVFSHKPNVVNKVRIRFVYKLENSLSLFDINGPNDGFSFLLNQSS